VCCHHMKLLNFLKHTGIIAAAVVLIVALPLWCTGYFDRLLSGSADAVSSASVVLDQPAGNYVILINKELHPDEETLNDWIRFFRSSDEEEELAVIFEDLACSVAAMDAEGVEMANSLCSQLPENQKKIRKEDASLLMSRADEGLFDVIIMSKEFADSYHAETAYDNSVEVVELSSQKK